MCVPTTFVTDCRWNSNSEPRTYTTYDAIRIPMFRFQVAGTQYLVLLPYGAGVSNEALWGIMLAFSGLYSVCATHQFAFQNGVPGKKPVPIDNYNFYVHVLRMYQRMTRQRHSEESKSQAKLLLFLYAKLDDAISFLSSFRPWMWLTACKVTREWMPNGPQYRKSWGSLHSASSHVSHGKM